jgi:hypothetical protein
MIIDFGIPEPFLFNPLKHHLEFIREFINLRTNPETKEDISELIKELKHLGTSVTDVYTGSLSVIDICREIEGYINNEGNQVVPDFRIITLSDGSMWTLKFNANDRRFIHQFPARTGPYKLRVKSNTLKTAVLYNILIGKDYINKDDLNRIRILLGLSPVKNTIDAEAVLEMIEILRG